MSDIFEKYGLSRVVNVSAKETAWGAARVHPEVIGAAASILPHALDLGQLHRAASAVWRVDRVKVDLKYRDDLPTKADLESERATLLAEEQAARDRGDEAAAADWRALVERNTRMFSRLRERPAGDGFRLGIVIWRMGDAIWLSVQGEPYSLLQTALRERFADRPIVVASVAEGWGPLYLPPAEIYGKGIYQESIAVLAPGCLEQLIEALEERIEKLI